MSIAAPRRRRPVYPRRRHFRQCAEAIDAIGDRHWRLSRLHARMILSVLACDGLPHLGRRAMAI
jgi:hypothetical protein